ncbi:MAG: CvpA family protein [Candidatus Dormibacteraceae bacterium]
MSWIDLLVAVLIVIYVGLGLRQGVIRRLLGIVALYAGFAAATFGSPLGGVLLQKGAGGLAYTDARLYAYFGILLFVTLAVEGLALAYRRQLEISYVAFDRSTGVAAGLATALLGSAVVVLLLGSAGNPTVGSRDVLQIHLRDSFNASSLGTSVLRALGRPAETFFYPALPHEPQLYFEVAPASS